MNQGLSLHHSMQIGQASSNVLGNGDANHPRKSYFLTSFHFLNLQVSEMADTFAMSQKFQPHPKFQCIFKRSVGDILVNKATRPSRCCRISHQCDQIRMSEPVNMQLRHQRSKNVPCALNFGTHNDNALISTSNCSVAKPLVRSSTCYDIRR